VEGDGEAQKNHPMSDGVIVPFSAGNPADCCHHTLSREGRA
jgi:hypothetical protein